MKTKYFYPNKDGNIEFTREELEKLLNDVYDEGREAGKKEITPYILNINEPTPYLPTIIYNTPPERNDITSPWWDPNWNKVYCTDDNSIGRITLEVETFTQGEPKC